MVDMNPPAGKKKPARFRNNPLKRAIVKRLRQTTPASLPAVVNRPASTWRRSAFPLVLTAVVCLVALLGCDNHENIKRGVLTGVVLDSIGNRLIGVTITSHRSLYVATTGSDGRYSFSSLDPGSHRLLVEHPGYQSASLTAVIASAEVQEKVDFCLEPLPERIKWHVAARASDSVTLDVTAAEPMSCMVAYQGDGLAQIRTPYSKVDLTHRFSLKPLLPHLSYTCFLEGRTADGRVFRSASGTFSPTPVGDLDGAPDTPTAFSVVQTKKGPSLIWAYEGKDALKGFRVYRDAADGTREMVRDESLVFSQRREFCHEEAAPGEPCRYALAAVDLEGNVSTPTLPLLFLPAGNLKKDVTWKASGEVFNLYGDLFVPSGITLTIEPGVTVRVAERDYSEGGMDAERCEVLVEGRMQISADSSAPVKFTSAASVPTRQEWHGIRFRVASGNQPSQVSYLEVFNADQGVSIFESSPEIKYVTAHYCRQGVTVQSASGTTLTGVVVEDCGEGIFVGDSYNVSIRDVSCRGGETGVNLLGNTAATLRNLSVRDVRDVALRIADREKTVVGGALLVSQDCGVQIGGGVATLTQATIDAPFGIEVNQLEDCSIRNSIIVNRFRPDTGKGIADTTVGRSYPYNNIFGFQFPVYNCNQNGGPVLNVDPLFVGGAASDFDYHLPDDSPLRKSSDRGEQIGAYGTPAL
jgi:hypothetical protein